MSFCTILALFGQTFACWQLRSTTCPFRKTRICMFLPRFTGYQMRYVDPEMDHWLMPIGGVQVSARAAVWPPHAADGRQSRRHVRTDDATPARTPAATVASPTSCDYTVVPTSSRGHAHAELVM